MRIWIVAAVLFGCTHEPGTGTGTATTTTTASAAVTATATAPVAVTATATVAQLGMRAPDFSLPDVDGKTVSLSQFKGRTVVLEWFNPKCPFVKRNHELGPLKDMAARVQKQGVVWLSINSGAKGKQGNGAEATKFGIAKYAMHNPVLLDEDGKVGHAYGANHTPHMFIVDANGNLAYRGAIDNAPDGDTDLGAPFINHVEAALNDLAANKPVSKPETQAYGCSVKYAD